MQQRKAAMWFGYAKQSRYVFLSRSSERGRPPPTNSASINIISALSMVGAAATGKNFILICSGAATEKLSVSHVFGQLSQYLGVGFNVICGHLFEFCVQIFGAFIIRVRTSNFLM